MSFSNLTLDYVLYELSYSNITMFSSVIPVYNNEDNEPERTYNKDLNQQKTRMGFGEFMKAMKGMK